MDINNDSLAEFEKANEEMEKAYSPLYNLADEFESDKEERTNELEVLYEKNKKILEEKKALIMKVLGNLYNGVLIDGKLSARKGELYEYKCRYTPSLTDIKKRCLENLHEIQSKLTEQNLEIMEFVLDKIEEKKPYNYEYEEEDKESLKLELEKPISFFEIEYGNSIRKRTINEIRINVEGKMKYGIKEGDKINDSLRIEELSKAMLNFKFKTELRELTNEFIIKETKKLESKKKDIEEIKLKATNILMLANL